MCWEMATVDFHAGMIMRHQRQSDTDIFALAQQIARILEDEGQTHQRRHRDQRDITLVLVQLDARDFLALIFALGHHANITHAASI